MTHPSEIASSSPEPQDSSQSVLASAFPNLLEVFPSISVPPTETSGPHPILFRATNGKSSEKRGSKVKISTVVTPADLDSFLEKYVEVCRAGMSDLRKRDRRKKDKKRKAKAKKEKVKSK